MTTDPFNPLLKIAIAQQVQNMMDDPYLYYKDNPSKESVDTGIRYLKENGISVPVIPTDDRSEDVKKSLYLAWHSLELLNMMCYLLGEQGGEKEKPKEKVSRFENIW